LGNWQQHSAQMYILSLHAMKKSNIMKQSNQIQEEETLRNKN